MAPMIYVLPFCKPLRSVRLGLSAAAWLAAGATIGPALALTGTNTNPGGDVVVTFTTHDQLDFLTADVVTQQVNAYATEIIGRLAGGAALYDITVPVAFGSVGVQDALASAQAALLTAGGPGTTFAMPALLNSASTTTSTSSSLYSLAPAIDGDLSKYFVITQTQTFGPALLQVAVSTLPSTVAYPGVFSLCGNNGTSQTPPVTTASATKPICSAVDPGTFYVLPGQLDINIDTTTTYQISTATTVTNTTTLTQAYELVGTPAIAPAAVPEPPGWTVLSVGVAALGLLARRSGRT